MKIRFHFIAFLFFTLTCRAAEAPPVPTLESSITPTLPDEWVHEHEAFVADAKARADQIQIVLVGNSISARWTWSLGQAVYNERYAPHGAINLSISGDTTENVLWRLQNGELDPLHPKMVLLLIGTNNWAEEPDAIAYGVWAVVDQIRRTHPETRVLVEGLFPRFNPTNPAAAAKLPMANKLLAKLDDGKMVKFIDFGAKLLKPDGGFNHEWFPDGTHPGTPVVYKLWADTVQPIVDDWLKEPPIPNVPPPPPPVPKPADTLSSTPLSRNGWLFNFNRDVVLAKQGKGELLFLGGTPTAHWSLDLPLFLKEYKAYQALNFGNFDNRTENVLWQLQNGGLGTLQPKLAVIQMQENLEDNTPVENVVAGMVAITKMLREKLPAAKILLEGAFPRGARPDNPMRRKLADYNAQLARLADNKTVFYLDVGAAFIHPDGTLDPTPGEFPFLPAAYEQWAAVQRDTITRLIAAKP